ncbi:uncharacterized protein MELLADRAFT_90787 [Melampsora larici-populina 98AG31]|uniref:CxC6 like cysteine cluster associated with KDZ domain-containing protein n=1 Tax=Melampsora larici-populina (strain 98AG31 / pathotype 3-4-7) TaxID=747676 RepID=F4R7H2_MELLP|nr:uncharacterized protein MELLADRAFT_90787 [Melampsora larici-populina 98AG31]EGG11788.1 hypothetical protein MELLADRAFT_90787 [Melampsora larici-populina 98AG31]
MLLVDFATRLSQHHPQLASRLTVTHLVKFVTLATEVYHRADKALQFNSQDTRMLPFLQLALQLQLALSNYNDLWNLTFPMLPFAHLNPGALIRNHGLHPRLTTKVHEVYLIPPTSTCFNCNRRSGHSLHQRPRIDGYLYDLDGIHSAEFHTWACLDVLPTIVLYLQKKKVLLYSGSGCGPTALPGALPLCYDSSTRTVISPIPDAWADQLVPTHSAAQIISHKMSEEFTRDALDLFSLLRRYNRRGAVVSVVAQGTQDNRLSPAMARELHHVANHGSKYRGHFCSLCFKTTEVVHEGRKATLGIRAVVTDGLTIGHWRCTVSSVQLEDLAHRAGAPPPNGPCLNPLPKVTSRFCEEHAKKLEGWCEAQPCTALAADNSKTCSNPAHVQAMQDFDIRKKKAFTLKSMLNRPGSNLPSDPSVHLNPDTLEIIDLEMIYQADEADRAHEAARDGGTAKPKGAACLSRSRTHNDQTVVGTCGIFLARQTFYNSEAPSALRDYLVDTFPNGLPEVIFYDNACTLLRVIHNGDIDPTPFANTIIPVDPFHHRAHAQGDEFCQMYTDPKLFPDIQENGSWVFNASAGELGNIWYGGFASMCRNMQATHYEFFLEEMVEYRNDWLSDALACRSDVKFIGLGKL